MNNEFADVMSKRSNVELLEIINSTPGDYQPLALEAAKIEFKRRNLSWGQMASVKDEIKRKQDFEYARANEPLSLNGKIFAFIFPKEILSALLWKSYLAEGQERKYNEKIRWDLYGLCFYVVAIVLITIIMANFSK